MEKAVNLDKDVMVSVAAMRSGAFRPGENGLGSDAAALVGKNVSRMTRQDYDKYCRMVERGERISFG